MKIKILVACHKPSELPQNELFLPIQVGAKNAKTRMNIEQDDNGINISEKNPTYCELTAQYWAWKNLDSDYYGLCHYRRFLEFKHTDARKNHRDQIEASVLNEYNIKQFGLDNSEEMRQVIEKYDVITGPEQNVNHLYTPRGSKSTAYDHWIAHDRALIMKKDLDLMLDILQEVAPEVGAAARKYLKTSHFTGFNCFVMKKELFDQMCQIEFEVLSRLEQQVDLSSYCQQITRIFGFMGEIISSSFIYYLEQTGKYKIKHIPLLYFNYTEPLEKFKPLNEKNKKSIPIVFDYADSDPNRFGVAWQTFLEHIDRSYQYDVVVIADFVPDTKTELQKMSKAYDNVSLRFMEGVPARMLLYDKYKLEEDPETVGKNVLNPENDDWHIPILPFLPFILTGYEKALVFDKNTLFCDSIVDLWENYRNSNKMICAPPSVFIRARINDIYYETAERHLKKYLKNPLNYFSINAFIWNFQEYRKNIKESKLVKLYPHTEEKTQFRAKEEILNIVCEDNVEFTDVRWNTWYDTNALLTYQLPYMPFTLYQELLSARKNPGMITYMANDPWEREFTALTPIFWNAAQKTAFYEIYLQHGTDLINKRSKVNSKEILTKIFPVDGNMRSRLTRLFPYNSKRNKAIKRVLKTLHLR